MATARALLGRFGTLSIQVGAFAITLLIWWRVQATRFGVPGSAAIIVAGWS